MNYKATSSALGKINALVMAYDESGESLSFIRNTIQVFTTEVKLIIFIGKQSQLKLELGEALSSRRNLKFIRLKEGVGSRGDWVRDYLHIAKAKEKTILLYRKPTNGIISQIRDCLQKVKVSGKNLVHEAKELSKIFAFGNVLIHDQSIFINGNWKDDRSFSERYDQEVKKAFFPSGQQTACLSVTYKNVSERCPKKNKNWGQLIPGLSIDPNEQLIKIQEIAPGNEPKLGHLDLYLTLTGIEAGGKPVLMVGYPETNWEKLEMEVRSTRCFINRIILSLENEGFMVLRNPVPFVPGFSSPEQQNFWIGYYNNCLVEVTEKSRRVWIPQYGKEEFPGHHYLKSTDDRNRTVWESLGFQVNFIYGGQRAYAKFKGSIHCLTLDIR